jgi:AcrR family transcriptional regulator
METTAIYKATLKLIDEGKYHSISMAEIAYHANLTERTVALLFRNRDRIINDLGKLIFTRINTIISECMQIEGTFEQRFFTLWNELRNFYSSQPEILAFINGSKGYDSLTPEVRLLEETSREMLHQFFTENLKSGSDPNLTPTYFAYTFHENIKSEVRFKLDSQNNREGMAHILWNAILAKN